MSVIRKIINSPLVPKLPGAYNQAVQVGNVLYVSGSLGLDEKTLKPVEGGAAAEAKQSLKNIQAILNHAGTSFNKGKRKNSNFTLSTM
ncbi:Endoribonuclease L-PSP/chorismate mutase-like,YjgF/YER057c/UK114 family [Cinara cedri]|uniref:Endoribonuclease L-PSP/chorismate mutase-like,YjgF/YER057c/UK114 family n=1 Tax=Cinara cedri TaxID=506608 RepID=A0A5E4NRW5_9HEMI|nr:Endoribonuclease L-PSP/chorismate mutase-like,YjgF/YER057c/UK114 family [Cinara cedri]